MRHHAGPAMRRRLRPRVSATLLVATALAIVADADAKKIRCPTKDYVIRIDGTDQFRGLFTTDRRYHAGDIPLDLELPPLSGGVRPTFSMLVTPTTVPGPATTTTVPGATTTTAPPGVTTTTTLPGNPCVTGSDPLGCIGAGLILAPMHKGWPIGEEIACPTNGTTCFLPRGRYRLSVFASDCASGVFSTPVIKRIGSHPKRVDVPVQLVSTDTVSGTIANVPAGGSASVTVLVYATPAAANPGETPSPIPRPLLCRGTATVTDTTPTYSVSVPHGSTVDVVAAVAGAAGTCGPLFRGETDDQAVDGPTTVDVSLAMQPLLNVQFPTTTTSVSTTTSTNTSTTMLTSATTTTVASTSTSSITTTTTVSTTTTLQPAGTTTFTHVAFPQVPTQFFDGATANCTAGADGSVSVRVPPVSENFVLLKPVPGGRGSLPFQPLVFENSFGACTGPSFPVLTADAELSSCTLKKGCPIGGKITGGNPPSVRIFGFSKTPRCQVYLAGDAARSGKFYGVTVRVDGDPFSQCPNEFGPTTTSVPSTTSTSVTATTTSTTTTTTLF